MCNGMCIIIKRTYNNKIYYVIFVHKSKNDIDLVQGSFFSDSHMSRIFWLKMIAVMTIVTCSTMKSSFSPLKARTMLPSYPIDLLKGKSQELTKFDIVLILVVTFFVVYTTLRAVTLVLGGSNLFSPLAK